MVSFSAFTISRSPKNGPSPPYTPFPLSVICLWIRNNQFQSLLWALSNDVSVACFCMCFPGRSAHYYIIYCPVQRSADWQAVSCGHGGSWVTACLSSSSSLAQAYSRGGTRVLGAIREHILMCKHFLSFCLHHIVCCLLAKSNNLVSYKSL